MKRRDFLTRFALALGLTATGISPPAKAIGNKRKLVIQESPLAGFNHHEASAIWPQLAVGDAVVLRREAKNPHDDRAVAVRYRGRMLGYLPRQENAAVAQMLDRGEKLAANIVAKRLDQDPWKRLQLAVFAEVAV